MSHTISDLLSQLRVQLAETACTAKDVLIEKESFAQLSSYLRKLDSFLNEIQLKSSINDSHTLKTILESLVTKIRNLDDLVNICRTKSKFYLFINCRSILKKLQQITNDIGRNLSLISVSHMEIFKDSKESIMRIFQEMQDLKFKTNLVSDEVAGKIEIGLQENKESSSYSNELLFQIAKAIGIELSPSLLKTELEQLKKDQKTAELQRNMAEALQIERVAALLSWADDARPLEEREKQYQVRRVSLGAHPILPLKSFCCPITQEVMEDPVEIASGHTYERAAIQKWFADGHTTCPVSFITVSNFELRHNKVLKRSIDEWRERNFMIQLTSMRNKLASEDEMTILATLEELHGMCELRLIHRHWVAAEGILPILVKLLKSSGRNIRKKAFSTLIMIINGNLELKRACEEGVIELSMCALARDVSESRQAVNLLLQLSFEQSLCRQLTKAHGCIFLLAALTKCEVPKVAEDAKAVLENISKINEENAVLMAEAGYFGPLVQHLNEGAKTTQMIMANALSQIKATDVTRRMLVEMGVLPPLVKMLSEGNLEQKLASLGALKDLSLCFENRDIFVKAGVMQPVLKLLFTKKSVLTTLREQAATVLANLASATSSSSNCLTDLFGTELEPKPTIYRLLSLINLCGPVIQIQLLKALHELSYPHSTNHLKASMREAGAVEMLLSLYDVNTDAGVRFHTIKLLHSITRDDGESLAKQMQYEVTQSLVNLLVNSPIEEEKAAVLGLFHNTPLDDSDFTDMLDKAELLSALLTILQMAADSGLMKELLESAVGVLLRFTVSSNLQLQKKVVSCGVIPLLLDVLKWGTPLAKCRAIISLGQLSESTWKQTCRVKKVTSFWCISPQVVDVCRVHGGVCTVEKSFCLVEAQAVPLLIEELKEQDPVVVGSALGAVTTLLYDEFWDKGVDLIAESGGVTPVINLLTIHDTNAQECALWILERIFRKERYRLMYGNSAQLPLISLTQDGTNKARHQAAKILAHLNILQQQSSYF
ncbi:hypothetical protein KP509_08G057000 [Ceratopteris richardii]|uniref:RING-type E3 ubiquitin transferase n=1 Tax=Ceratopteris richardii TaxID=49495 RepID=A0A8T2UCS4_CERRI|nr:hypothetical protein KP509_08G057000 [Ceratopteris richardii]